MRSAWPRVAPLLALLPATGSTHMCFMDEGRFMAYGWPSGSQNSLVGGGAGEGEDEGEGEGEGRGEGRGDGEGEGDGRGEGED